MSRDGRLVPVSEPAELRALAERLQTAASDLLAQAPAVATGEPWPLSEDFGVRPESYWGPPETLAHVAEMLPFWMGEIERILAGGPEPVPFGRVADDDVRLAIIGRDRTVPVRELFARIAADADRVGRRLLELDPEAASRRGVHPRLGELTIAAIADRFIVGHVADHAEQLAATLREP